MAGAKFLQWAMFWTFEKRTFDDDVQSGGFGDADSGFAGLLKGNVKTVCIALPKAKASPRKQKRRNEGIRNPIVLR